MRKFLIPILFCILVLSLVTEMYTPLSIALSLVIFYCMLDKFGKGIVLLETMAFYSCVIYLLMPLLGYSIYTRNSRIAVLWAKVMPVPYLDYFQFMLPAICAYLLGLFLINYLTGRLDEGQEIDAKREKIVQHLASHGNMGLVLILAGLSFYFLRIFFPGPLAAVAGFGYQLIFPGLLYLHFQPKFRGRMWIYLLVAVFLLRESLNTGMFTVTFYMSVTIISFFLISKKIKFPTKIVTIVTAICALFVLQLVKISFRNATKKGNYAGSRAELFQDLVITKTGELNNIISANAFFPIYVRLNQGFTTAMVIRRIPAMQPYDGGESIFMTLAASVIPRVLWPDKPESGGVYNMKHFAGFTLKGWSTNIGPVGEGYGNFGPVGGIIYMFFYGLFIGWAYVIIFKLSRKTPLLILWMPLLFYEVMYAMENDTLQALNSLIKGAIFVWALSKLFPYLFRYTKKINRAKSNQNGPYFRDNGTGWGIPDEITH